MRAVAMFACVLLGCGARVLASEMPDDAAPAVTHATDAGARGILSPVDAGAEAEEATDTTPPPDPCLHSETIAEVCADAGAPSATAVSAACGPQGKPARPYHVDDGGREEREAGIEGCTFLWVRSGPRAGKFYCCDR